MRIFALIIAFAIPSWGQQSPVVGSYRDFAGGLNNDDASVSIAANESPNLLNVVIDNPRGALTQRNGYQSCGTTPSGNIVTNLYEYAKNDGTRRLIVTDNTTVWQTANCIDFSTVTTGLNSLELPRFATVLDDLWIVNGSTWPIVWNGSTSTQLDGQDARPEGPIGKYISYWKSRVWIANVPTSPSSVFFSALVDASGNILDPETSTSAWISTNQLYINRDDGSPVYGMKPYRDNLYIWKETGINRILFESDFDLSLTKNVSNTGSKFNESIVEMDDGLIRFLGEDGIYAFDGISVKRLSSKITPTIDSIKQQTGGQGFQLWDTAANFIEGDLTDTSTEYYSSKVSIDIDKSTNTVLKATWTITSHSGGGVWTYNALGTDTSFSGAGTFSAEQRTPYSISENTISATGAIISVRLRAYAQLLTGTGYGTSYMYFISDNELGSSTNGYRIKFHATYNPNSRYVAFEKVTAGTVVLLSSHTVTPAENNLECYALKISVFQSSFTAVDSACGVNLTATDSAYREMKYLIVRAEGYSTASSPALSSMRFWNIRYPEYHSTGTYTSQISTFTGLTQWRTFAVDETLNGQTIAYYVRTGTTAYNTSIASWFPISSGLIISTTADQYAQWKAEFTTTNNSVTPLINSVSMGYATGDTSATAVKGIQYKSRLWLAASTSTANNFNDMVIVESKSPLNSYTLYDLPISAMAIWSGNLYGAIGNTGNIARLDYGDTDDGAAISSFWESRDEVFDKPIFYKTVNQVILDYANSPANTSLSVGLSPDQGSTYQTRSVNLGASSLPRNTAKLNYAPETALGFRTRISNSTLGYGFKIYGIHPFGTIIPYMGN